jgi:hypothetical protein
MVISFFSVPSVVPNAGGSYKSGQVNSLFGLNPL